MPVHRKFRVAFLFLLVLLSGCAGKSVFYRSTDPRYSSRERSLSAQVEIPDQTPSKSYLIFTYLGIKPFKDTQKKALYFSVFIDNQGTKNWKLDTMNHQLFLSYGDSKNAGNSDLLKTEVKIEALENNSSNTKLTSTKTFTPGPTRYLELMFPLPESFQNTDLIPSFILSGKIKIANWPFEYQIPFSKELVPQDELSGNSAHWKEHHEKLLNNPLTHPNGTAAPYPYKRLP